MLPIITGMGCISALGHGVDALWNGLLHGRSGIRPITSFAHDGLRNVKAGTVPDGPELGAFAHEYGIRHRLLLYALIAIDEALADAGIDRAAFKEKAARGRAVVLLGTSLGMSLVDRDGVPDEVLTIHDGDPDNADLDRLAAEADRLLGAPGATTIVSTACASSTHALALARDLIRAGEAELVVAGGADSLDRMKYLGHSALQTLSLDVPRPFSTARDGTLFGEGAGFLVVEPARARAGRPVRAALVGAGYSTDITHVTAPDPEGSGAAMAMRSALIDSGITPEAVGHVNLHGSGTALNDIAEAKAMAAVFGSAAAALPATSIKAAVGHAMGAAGAIEAIATIRTLETGLVPPTLGLGPLEVDGGLDIVTGSPRRVDDLVFALSNSFGFGGANGVVALAKTSGEVPA